MDKRRSQKAPTSDDDTAIHAADTQVARDSATPVETDPSWHQLGSTRVSDNRSDDSNYEGKLNSPSNYTEIAPSRILGRDVDTLGDFRLIRKIGEGAMGAVYKAQQISTQRTVALKILFPHVANNPKLIERLYREGQVMGLLSHPNIVEAYGNYRFTDPGAKDMVYHCVAMEYVSGQSLQKWLSQLGRLPVRDAVRITLDCAQALAFAHSQNIIHRDIKPDNILLTRAGVVKLADLGMVKVGIGGDEEMSLTQTGHAVGTPWFMPLEQARNAKEIDGRSDIYALGCTLFALVTGRPPFMGRTIVDVIRAKEIGTIASARQANSDVPERLDLILGKMTAKSPKNRYQTCEEVIADLESLDLANRTISFIGKEAIAKSQSRERAKLEKTAFSAPIMKSNADVDYAASAAPVVDKDQWFVQLQLKDGTTVTRKYNTTQLSKMLTEGTMAVTAHASHASDGGFRAISTYKEFQGFALGKMTKKAADKNSARTRGLLKRIEAEDAKQASLEEAKGEETAIGANLRYWFGLLYAVLPLILLILLFIGVVYASSSEAGWSGVWWAPAMPFAGLILYLIYWFSTSKR